MAGDVTAPPRVFISYAHDSDDHLEKVRDLWVFLCANGVEAHIDRVAAQERQGWTMWMERQIAEADRRVFGGPQGIEPGTRGLSASTQMSQACWIGMLAEAHTDKR